MSFPSATIKAGLSLLFCLATLSQAQVVCDSTIVFDGTDNSPTSTFDPTPFNTHLDSLDETTCISRIATFTLDFQDLPTDTVYLSGPVNLSPTDSLLRTDFQVISSTRAAGQIIFLASTNSNNPVITVDGRFVNVQSTGFISPGSASSIVAAAGARNFRVSNCQFLINAGSAISVSEDSVLIEKNFFKNPGSTFLPAIDNSNSVVEIRSNLFMTSGITSSSHGIHILANTFVGKMDVEAITISDATAPGNDDFKIQHNLFAFDNPLLPPIRAESDLSAAPTDSIVRNAFVQGISPFINNATQQVELADNVFLPPGLADYPNSDFPLVQMHTDPSLLSNDPAFGHVPEVYKNFTQTIPTIQSQLLSSNFGILLSPVNGFTSFSPNIGITWNTDMRVGCFSVYDPNGTIFRPSPIEIISYAANQYTISQTLLNFDDTHYGQDHTTQLELFYFMSNSPAISAKDTTDIANRDFFWDGVVYAENGQGINFPTLSNTNLAVPDSLRNGGPIYVKMVHKNDNGFAVLDLKGEPIDGIIQTVQNVPEYPATDFTLEIKPNDEIQHQLGVVRLDFTQGVEVIQSIQVQAFLETDSSIIVDTVLSDDNLSLIVFNELPERATVCFRGFPIGSSGEIGKDTVTTACVPLNEITSNFVYVTPRASCLLYPANDGLGLVDDPFCRIEHALNEAALRPTTIIVDVHPTEKVPITDVIIDATHGTEPLTIVSQAYRDIGLKERPVLSSISVDRPNTTIQGFVIENVDPVKPAISLRSNNIRLDGNVLRFSQQTAFTGELVKIEQTLPTDTVQIMNNMLFNGTPSVMVSGPGEIRIFNNTFISTDTTATGISRLTSLLISVNVVIANNYFSGNNTAHNQPFDPILQPVVSDLQPILFSLERNAFADTLPPYFELDTLIKNIPQLQPVTPIKIETHGADQANFLSLFVKSRSEDVLTCLPDQTCSPLSLGASPNYVSNHDIFGNERTGLRDVGAIEDLDDSPWVSGQIAAFKVAGRADSIVANVTSLNFDTVQNPLIYIWWDQRALGNDIPPRDSALADTAISAGSAFTGGLNGLNLTLGINGLQQEGGIIYTVCHAFGTAVSENSHGSCVEITTDAVVSAEGCGDEVVDIKKCPNGLIWPFVDATFGNVTSMYTWTTPSDSLVLNPISGGQVTDSIRAEVPALTLAAGLPYITSDLTYHTIDPLAGSDNFFNINVVIPQLLTVPAGTQLYRRDLTNRIFFVPQWSIDVNATAGTSTINIESKPFKGTFYFATGAATGQATGTITATTTSGPVDISSKAVNIDVSGIQFVTQNPLIFITAIPTGSMGNNVFDPAHFSKPVLLSQDLSVLGPALKQKWGNSYYQMLAQSAATAVPAADFGKIPIGYSIADETTFSRSIDIKPLGGAVGLDGSIPVTSIIDSIVNGAEIYPSNNTKRKRTRGIEFVFTIFDAGNVTFARAMVASEFCSTVELCPQRGSASNEITAGTATAHIYDIVNLKLQTWELFAYPWQEKINNNNIMTNAVGEPGNWDELHQAAMQYNGIEFTEFDGENQAAFTVDSGRAIWVAKVDGIKRFFLPHTNGGVTLDNQNFSIALAAGQWRDFGIPYNFPIKLQDVITQSAGYADAIWEYNPNWFSEGLEPSLSWNVLDPAATLHPWKGYTTRPAAAANLVFPTLDIERSNQPEPLPKKSIQGEFFVSLKAYNNTAAASISMGKKSVTRTVGQAPHAPGQNFTAYIRGYDAHGSPEVHSREVISPDGKYNSVWPVAFTLAKGGQDIKLKYHVINGLPDHIHVWLLNATSSELTLLNGTTPAVITASDTKNDYSIVVGTPDYANGLKNLKFFRFNNIPNPFTGLTVFKYTLPPAYTSGPGSAYTLNIHNLKGENVKVYRGQLKKGGTEIQYSWKGRDKYGKTLPPGNYIASISITAPGQKTLKSSRKLVKLD